MYMQLQQRHDANESFNRGLGLMAASAYPGRHPEMIMNAMTGASGADPGSTFGNLMKIQQWNIQNQQQAAFRASIPQMLKNAGLDESLAPLVAMDPSIMSKVAETQAGVGGSPAWQAQIKAERALTSQGKPVPWTPGDPTSYQAYTTANTAGQVADERDFQKETAAASTDFPALNSQHGEIEGLIKDLKDNPNTIKAVQSLLPTTGAAGAFRSTLGQWGIPGGLDQGTADAAGKLQLLHDKLYASGWTKGNRLSQAEAARLGNQFSTLTNPNQSAAQITDQLNQLGTLQATAHANAAAAAGKPLSQADYDLADSAYKPGGKYYNGAKVSEDAPSYSSPAASSSSGGGTKMSADDLATAKTLIARDGRASVIAHLKAKGYDTSGL
jgi:hypothetical protein